MTSVVRGNDGFDSALSLITTSPTSVLGIRAVNTDYTNSSGGVRRVYISGNNGTAGVELQVSFNSGSTWMAFGGSFLPSGLAQGYGSFDVPPGGTYRVRSSTGTLVLASWWEQE